MLRTILTFGVITGLIVAVPMFVGIAIQDPGSFTHSYIFGYTIMFLALSLIFVAVKRVRDRIGGGVIRFLPALGIGLGISAVAGVIYVIGWEITLAATNFAFVADYSASMIEAARAKGASAAELARATAEAAKFQQQYANPLFRMPMTFVEIFPVGVLVSVVAAGLLRNSRFLPMKVVQD